MDIKMIALDMDGTLLNSDSKISVRNLDILIKLQEKGIRVVLASGRNYHKLEDYGKQLKMDRFDGYYIEVNGMAIKPAFNSERRIIERLKLADAKRIYKFIEKQSIEFQFLMDMHVYIRIPESMLQRKIDYRIENNIASNVPWRASTVAPTLNINSGYPVTIYVKDDDILKEDLNKVCLAGNIEEVEHVNQLLRAEFKDEFWIGKTAAMWLEVCPKGNTKGNALETLANELNISSDEIMAFGDGENDIEMLKFAKYSYAMSNALPSVKAASSGTTLSNDEDGVYEILKNLIN